MAAKHIAFRAVFLDMRPLLVDIHHVNGFVFVNRADQLRILVLFLADGEVHVRRRAVHRDEFGLRLIFLRQLDALMRRCELPDIAAQNIAAHTLLDHGKPRVAQLGDIYRFSLGKHMQLERGFALFRADGQLARRNADILRVCFVVVARRGSQILNVFAEHIADHTVLINLCPCIVEFNDIDEFARRHAAQLLRGRGFFRSYRHVLGNGSCIKDILSQCL